MMPCALYRLRVAQIVATAQNTNNTTIKSFLQHEKLTRPNFTNWYQNLRIVLRSEGKLAHLEQPLIPLFLPVAPQAVRDTYEVLYDVQNEVACLMLGRTVRYSQSIPCLQQEDGQSVSAYILKMKGYLDTLERLGYAIPKEFGVSLILKSLNKDYDQFVQNFNMHSMGKSIVELHAMLKLHEKGIPKKAKTPVVLAIWEGKIQKDKKKPQGVKGKDKGKNKLVYAPKPKIPPPPKSDNPTKHSVCHHRKDVGH
ncbi:hypothetical protein Tco_0684765 [Tanacetum coccineum]